MWNRKDYQQNLKSLAQVVLALSLAACGSQESGPAPNPWGSVAQQPAPACPVGYVQGTYGCIPSNQYSSSSSFITSTVTPSVCYQQSAVGNRRELLCSIAWGQGFDLYTMAPSTTPVLSGASDVSGAWWGPEVKTGDQIRLEGSRFIYGDIGWESFNPFDGKSCKNEKNGLAQMKGAVNTEYFSLAAGSTVTANSNGVLRIGLPQRSSCMKISGDLVIRITRTL